MKQRQHWLSQQYKQKHLLRQLCGTAVQQQINQGDIPATQLRNRRRFLAKNIIKRMPCTRLMSPNRFLHTASLVLAMWGLSAVIAPSQAIAGSPFKDELLSSFVVKNYGNPYFVDIDNDGDLDAFVGESRGMGAGPKGAIKFYRNTGTANASEFTVVTGAANPLNGFDPGYRPVPSFVDIDNDGDMDMFVGTRYSGVKFYRNTGTANTPVFSAETGDANPMYGFNAGTDASPSFVDIDNDGDMDVFVGKGGGKVRFYRNTGTANAPVFSAETADANPLNGFDVGRLASPEFVDIDNDGDMDVFVGESNGSVKFYRNTGTVNAPVFSAETGATNPLNGFDMGLFASPSFVDIDNDGDMDVFIGSRYSKVNFYRNMGTANAPVFSAETGVTNPINDFDVGDDATPSFVDIDNDGDMDVFVGERFGTIKFYRNSGTANAPVFSAETGAANPLNGFDVGYRAVPSFVDIDNDGDMDAFVGEKYGLAKFYRNTGTATAPVFSAETGAANPLNDIRMRDSLAPSFVDIDNDGDMDVFLGNRLGVIKFYRNTGTANAPVFSAETGDANPLNGFEVGSAASPSFVDIDSDGDMDAFVGEYYGKIKFYRNTGTANAPVFSAETGAANPLNGFDVGYLASPRFVDIDNDGDMDVFVGQYYGEVSFFENVEVQSLSLPEDAGDLRVQVLTSGAAISSNSLTAAPLVNPPEGNFPFGKISYNLSTVAGGTASVRMVFPSDLPAGFKLYQIDAADNFTLIANTQYTQVDATTIDLTLSDGGPLDLDGDSSNGLIVAPVTASIPATEPATATASSGGGALSPWSLMFLVSALLARRRRLC